MGAIVLNFFLSISVSVFLDSCQFQSLEAQAKVPFHIAFEIVEKQVIFLLVSCDIPDFVLFLVRFRI